MTELYSFEAEQKVIGCCLNNHKLIDQLEIKPVHFKNKILASILGTVIEMHGNGDDVNIISVGERMASDKIFTSIKECAASACSEKLFRGYARLIIDFHNKRKAADLLSDASYDLSMGKSAIDALAPVVDFNKEVELQGRSGNVLSVEDMIEQTTNEMERSLNSIKVGIKTNIPEIDERLGYKHLEHGGISVIGALSKNGKTLLANTITGSIELEEGETGLIFSIEMTAASMFNSIISAITGVPSDFYCRQDYYAERYPDRFDTLHGLWGSAAQRLLAENKYFIDDRNDVDADYICTQLIRHAKRAKLEGKKLRYCVIDHLHRMDFDIKTYGSMTLAIRNSVRKIKNVAADLGISVILLAQLNNTAQNEEPNSYHILDSASVRHELQVFIGIKMFREDGETFFGIYTDAHRWATEDTKMYPAYMKLIGGSLRSLPEYQSNWMPSKDDN